MNSLTCVTLNIQEAPGGSKPAKWIAENILQAKPDVIFFQNVDNNILLQLIKKLRRTNYYTKVSNQYQRNYELIATLWPIVNITFKRYSTGRRFGVFWADINVFGVIITVASTLLDSLNKSKRAGQLQCLLKFFNKRENSVIIGCSTGFLPGESVEIPDGWRDAWISSGKNKFARYTIDFNLNEHANIQARPDRIYYTGDFYEPEFSLIRGGPFIHFAVQVSLQLGCST